MMDFALKDNDIEVSDNDITLCPTHAACLTQTITTRLKTIQGEWFLDESIGIPYFTQIFGRARGDLFIRELIVGELRTLPGVKEITNFKTTTSSERAVTISFDAVFSDGSLKSFKESVGV